MENKINIAELLKGCPKGMELDCVIFNNVTLECVSNRGVIWIKYINSDNNGRLAHLTSYGSINLQCQYTETKCIIFPKGKTTWEGFVPPCKFKDGDIIYNQGIKATAIFYKQTNDCTVSHCFLNTLGELRIFHYHSKDLSDWRFATEEEKQKLFQTIKANGYRWNAETKTLEKLIEPKFKVGDIVKPKNGRIPEKIISIQEDYYEVKYELNGRTCTNMLYFSNQNNYELLPDKFDIATLKPFESRVLVRNDENQCWIPAFWGYKRDDGYATTFGWSKYCIPYKGNEILFKTNKDCDDFYKTWEK